MLIGFLGSSFSGKTTVSCNMFARFKLNSSNSELLLEEARRYISEYRSKNDLKFNSEVKLTDTDQLEIANRQYKTELNFKNSCGPNTIIISDSSVYNSYLYMSEETKSKPYIQNFFFNTLNKHYDLIFYCHPVDYEFLPTDSNRIHSKDELMKIELQAKELKDKLKANSIHIETLLNDAEARIRDACSITLNKYCALLETTPQHSFEIIKST